MPRSRRFSLADQGAFADVSGDRNPIHLDVLAARRTQAGAVVVHGVHGLLWALEAVAASEPLTDWASIEARFLRFVSLDEAVELTWRREARDLVIDLESGGETATRVKVQMADPVAEDAGAAAVPIDLRFQPFGERAQAQSLQDMAKLHGAHAEPGAEAKAAALFPKLSRQLGAAFVASIAACTGVVGMKAPGLHSLFTGLSLRRVRTGVGQGVSWKVARVDPRTRWVSIDFKGVGWTGRADCFARQEPPQSAAMADLRARVIPGEFGDRVALVIGGSRGIGAATAKLLAAGGAHVTVTYARGREDAEGVAAEIEADGSAGVCATMRCDVHGDMATQLADASPDLSHLYYFATPIIAKTTSEAFDRRRFDAFVDVYVDGFFRTCAALAGRPLRSVLYPSTIFVERTSRGMAEYAIAKSAGEALCRELSARSPATEHLSPRLPRILTDQTATSPPTPAEDPLDVMLPLLRAQQP